MPNTCTSQSPLKNAISERDPAILGVARGPDPCRTWVPLRSTSKQGGCQASIGHLHACCLS
eukprot:1138862-Pelagomonas_calceolata.AAC.2